MITKTTLTLWLGDKTKITTTILTRKLIITAWYHYLIDQLYSIMLLTYPHYFCNILINTCYFYKLGLWKFLKSNSEEIFVLNKILKCSSFGSEFLRKILALKHRKLWVFQNHGKGCIFLKRAILKAQSEFYQTFICILKNCTFLNHDF
jgi:hypothetical protein